MDMFTNNLSCIGNAKLICHFMNGVCFLHKIMMYRNKYNKCTILSYLITTQHTVTSLT
jgi:hypothetical protein